MIKDSEKGLVIKVKIIPNSVKNEIVKESSFYKIKVTAQPVENKANKALIEFLSKQFKIPKTKISIIKGITSKEKTILFSITDEEKKANIISQLTK